LGDFGSTEFFTKEQLRTARFAVPMEILYRAPECDVEGPLELCNYSENCDVWALGCVWLECISWIVLGNDSIHHFLLAREEETDDLGDGTWTDPKFFSTLKPKSGLVDFLLSSVQNSTVVSGVPIKQKWVIKKCVVGVSLIRPSSLHPSYSPAISTSKY
jgi:serine/threonine protein kinase